MAKHNELGHEGEEIAAEYLRQEGYAILHRNWKALHSRHELDIVAQKDRLLVVVEVKTRASRNYGEPEDAVDWRKQQSIVAATNAYVMQYRIDLPIRFDIISIVGEGAETEIKHIERAFLPRPRYR